MGAVRCRWRRRVLLTKGVQLSPELVELAPGVVERVCAKVLELTTERDSVEREPVGDRRRGRLCCIFSTALSSGFLVEETGHKGVGGDVFEAGQSPDAVEERERIGEDRIGSNSKL